MASDASSDEIVFLDFSKNNDTKKKIKENCDDENSDDIVLDKVISKNNGIAKNVIKNEKKAAVRPNQVKKKVVKSMNQGNEKTVLDVNQGNERTVMDVNQDNENVVPNSNQDNETTATNSNQDNEKMDKSLNQDDKEMSMTVNQDEGKTSMGLDQNKDKITASLTVTISENASELINGMKKEEHLKTNRKSFDSNKQEFNEKLGQRASLTDKSCILGTTKKEDVPISTPSTPRKRAKKNEKVDNTVSNKTDSKINEVNTGLVQNDSALKNKLDNEKLLDKNMINITFNEHGKITQYTMKEDDSFETIFNELIRNRTSVKIMYKNIPVSKYLTPVDLGCTSKENVFEVIDENKDKDISIKVNLSASENVVFHVPPTSTVSDLVERIEFDEAKKRQIVFNGYILGGDLVISDVLEEDDVVDFI